MVVQHNLTAMNSNRMLNITTKSQSKSTEKLSSGYKINRAADDAAGLSISEKMRKQMRGLTQASSNAQDGISAVQTAEGALNEVQDMLQRMNELAVKAANGTNSKDDRAYIQAEVDQLVTEIDRVATTTKFNETYLLKGVDTDGLVGGLKFTNATASLANANIGAFDKSGIAILEKTSATNYVIDKTLVTGGNANGTAKGDSFEIAGKTYHLLTGTNAAVEDASGNPLEVSMEKVAEDLNAKNAAANGTNYYFTSKEDMLNAIKADLAEANIKDVKNLAIVDGDLQITAFADINEAVDLSLHVGADSSKDNKIGLQIQMMSARYLEINGIRVDGDSDENATGAIDIIADALQKVSSQRSALGAVQNRLEHTIANLDNIVENTTSAESAIRDTDMATEMVTYSNNNILAQAGQAMLAQANQANQGVLSLLG